VLLLLVFGSGGPCSQSKCATRLSDAPNGYASQQVRVQLTRNASERDSRSSYARTPMAQQHEVTWYLNSVSGLSGSVRDKARHRGEEHARLFQPREMTAPPKYDEPGGLDTFVNDLRLHWRAEEVVAPDENERRNVDVAQLVSH
jgi:hypothetical protein